MISDDSLPASHMYFWMCDMRNPGGSSFVEVLHVAAFFFFPILIVLPLCVGDFFFNLFSKQL